MKSGSFRSISRSLRRIGGSSEPWLGGGGNPVEPTVDSDVSLPGLGLNRLNMCNVA